MIKLETEFVSGAGGFTQAPGPLTYKQVIRSDTAAVYQRFYADGEPKDFETFYIRVEPKGKINKFPNGTTTTLEDDTENYPSTGQFGRVAWSFGNKGAAINKYEEICKQVVDDAEEEANPSVKKEFTIPVGEFTIKNFAEKNSVNYIKATLWMKEAITNGSVKCIGEKHLHARGKASKIFVGKST